MEKKTKLNKAKVDQELYEEIEENVLPPENIVVLNELRSASDLYRLMKTDESIELHPDFQRDEVWTPEARARFIDSLSKEFPIPSMCFALDPKEQRYIVIDGLQRMSTIKQFLENRDLVLPKLKDIDQKISGKSVSAIKKENPEIFRRIENISLPVTILRYDPKREDNMNYIFTIFQRLNTFGERLNNQEIRNAIYQGPLNSFIKECAKNKTWIELARSNRRGRGSRMIAEEKVLRFFAFHDSIGSYDGKFNKFLNDYMGENRYEQDHTKKEKLFESTVELINKMGIKEFGKSNAFLDAVLFGIAKNISSLKSLKVDQLRAFLNEVKKDDNFSVQALSEGTMQKNKVKERFAVAEKIFAGKR